MNPPPSWRLVCRLAVITILGAHAPAQAQAVQPPGVTVVSPSSPAGGGAAPPPVTNIAPPPAPAVVTPASGAGGPAMSISPIGDPCRNLTAEQKAAIALCQGR